jgi:hypothetical protein
MPLVDRWAGRWMGRWPLQVPCVRPRHRVHTGQQRPQGQRPLLVPAEVRPGSGPIELAVKPSFGFVWLRHLLHTSAPTLWDVRVVKGKRDLCDTHAPGFELRQRNGFNLSLAHFVVAGSCYAGGRRRSTARTRRLKSWRHQTSSPMATGSATS